MGNAGGWDRHQDLSNASALGSLGQSARRWRRGGRLARILVTGAAGFIGRALCGRLVERGHAVLGCSRHPGEAIPDVEVRAVGDIGPSTDWSGHLDRIDIV